MPERFCIYCFSTDETQLSKQHLFPKSIGGRVTQMNVCHACNSLLGKTIESEVSRCPFFCTAMAKLKLKDPEKAFKGLGIVHKETKNPIRLIDGEWRPIPKHERGVSYSGTEADSLGCFLRDVKRDRPNWYDYAVEQLNSGVDRIHVCDRTFHVQRFSMNDALVAENYIKFPIGFLAKTVFEMMVGFEFPSHEGINSFRQSTIDVFGTEGKPSRIQVSDSFVDRLCCYNVQYLESVQKMASAEYSRFHRIDFGVTEKNTAYILVVYFELVAFAIPICTITNQTGFDARLLGRRFVWPIDKTTVVPEEYESQHEEWRKRLEVDVDERWNTFRSRHLKKGQ